MLTPQFVDQHSSQHTMGTSVQVIQQSHLALSVHRESDLKTFAWECNLQHLAYIVWKLATPEKTAHKSDWKSVQTKKRLQKIDLVFFTIVSAGQRWLLRKG